MSARAALEILVVEDETSIADAMAGALRRRGHVVAVARTAEEALALPTPRVLVCSVDLPDLPGLDLLERMQARGLAPRTILVSASPTVDDCRRGMHLGAAEFLVKPFRLEELVRAVEDERARPSSPHSEPARQFSAKLAATLDDTERCVRALLAFLVRRGVSPSTRARIASACAEALDNAMRHAYPGGGEIELVARLDERELEVEILDRGTGFDAVRVAATAMRSPLESGLARAAALAEGLRLDSAPGRGTRVELRFACCMVCFDDEGLVDLSELDFLTPSLARKVLRSLREASSEPLFNLSPALAVSVGRLLSARTEERALQTALWS